MSKKRVLIVGGTGYLGQHLLQSFSHADSQFALAFTHHSPPPHMPFPTLFLSASIYEPATASLPSPTHSARLETPYEGDTIRIKGVQ